jgi:hypothetical protein
MILDIDKLSPYQRFTVIEKIHDIVSFLYQERAAINTSLPNYPEGRVLDEMKAWAAASQEKALELTEWAIQQKKKA